MHRIRVDIYSDTGCPWCYIGNKYLDLAIEEFSRRDPDAVFELAWHPFFLFPNAKVSAYQKGDVFQKIMGPERAVNWFRSLDAAAEPLNIRFNWNGKTGHTGDSHKLLLRASDLGMASSRGGSSQQHQQAAASAEPHDQSGEAASYPSPLSLSGHGDDDDDSNNNNNNNDDYDESSGSAGHANNSHVPAAWPTTVGPEGGNDDAGITPLRRLVRRFFQGSFEGGRDISDRAFLAEAAVAAGVAADQAEVLRWLDHPDSAAQLAARTARGAEAAGAAGMPCFVVQGKFKVGGAQPPGVFLNLFDRLGKEGLA